ncbi:MAG: site-2 protease family protein [Candidatus Omnitrophica bacterium]|nr:site-2 protease family protein [Candidatus Omnitrophota bacterium]
MGLLSLLINNPTAFVLLAFPLLYSIIFHELAHGLVASWFGDDTAKNAGRLSLNPLDHLDPLGTLMLFLVGFGWAKPVPVDYYSLKKSRFGLIAVSLAGCVTNILLAIIAIFLLQFQFINANSVFLTVLTTVARINIILGAFNLIPIPPLDGSKVLMALLPEEAQMNLAKIEPYGMFIIIFMLFTGMMYPLINFMQNIIYSFISVLFR